jgi:class 3 adenylate cyclase
MDTRFNNHTFLDEIKPEAVHSLAMSTSEKKNIPYVSSFRTALLFVDISGFTKLSTEMDPENLSKVISKFL